MTSSDKPLLNQTMKELLDVARGNIWQSKVVALNILTFIFKNAAFGTSVIPYISDAFMIVLPGDLYICTFDIFSFFFFSF